MPPRFAPARKGPDRADRRAPPGARFARAQAQARAIRRANRAGADARPRPPAIARELGSRRAGQPGSGKNGTEWNERR